MSKPSDSTLKEKLVFNGWLKKKSPRGIPLFKKWQKRWFELEFPHKINYYKDEKKAEICGIIPLDLVDNMFWSKNRISLIMHGDENDPKKKVTKRKFNLKSDSEADCEAWVKHIEKAFDQLDREEDLRLQLDKEAKHVSEHLTEEDKAQKYWKPEARKQMRLSVHAAPVTGRKSVRRRQSTFIASNDQLKASMKKQFSDADESGDIVAKEENKENTPGSQQPKEGSLKPATRISNVNSTAQEEKEKDAGNATEADLADPGYASLCTIHPTFTILKKDECMEMMKKCVEGTKKEKGCIYYGWTVEGDKLFCREAYVDGDAIVEHLKNAGPIIGPCLEAGVLKLESFQIHCGKDELPKLKKDADGFGAVYYIVDSGFYNDG